jgi:hypothetical protein
MAATVSGGRLRNGRNRRAGSGGGRDHAGWVSSSWAARELLLLMGAKTDSQVRGDQNLSGDLLRANRTDAIARGPDGR